MPVLAAQISGLSEHRPATATEMVHTALQHRPVTDLVRLFAALYQADCQRHIEAALPALVAARTVQECADLLEQLLATPAEDGAVALLRLTAELKPAGVITTNSGRPLVSTTRCRLRPLIFFPAS
ncbi:hypothetical protein [Streptomyces sp. Ru87]|uniref:hypothetical protein n=1 Tax=Streptomyces sp. Ru87 TaxID=2044307 RepID=UPI0015D46E2D|nr:hypothetical protein [Streptomyces sp. Ru87]